MTVKDANPSRRYNTPFDKREFIFPPFFQRGVVGDLKASGYKLGILVNFSKSKVEYQRVLIR